MISDEASAVLIYSSHYIIFAAVLLALRVI